jgi:hypothetical protein
MISRMIGKNISCSHNLTGAIRRVAGWVAGGCWDEIDTHYGSFPSLRKTHQFPIGFHRFPWVSIDYDSNLPGVHRFP